MVFIKSTSEFIINIVISDLKLSVTGAPSHTNDPSSIKLDKPCLYTKNCLRRYCRHPLQTFVRTVSGDPRTPTMILDHPSPVPMKIGRMLRVLSEGLLFELQL